VEDINYWLEGNPGHDGAEYKRLRTALGSDVGAATWVVSPVSVMKLYGQIKEKKGESPEINEAAAAFAEKFDIKISDYEKVPCGPATSYIQQRRQGKLPEPSGFTRANPTN